MGKVERNWLEPLWHLAQMYGCAKPDGTYNDEEEADIKRWRAELIEQAQNGGWNTFSDCRRQMIRRAQRVLKSDELKDLPDARARTTYVLRVFRGFRVAKFMILAKGTWPDDLTPGI